MVWCTHTVVAVYVRRIDLYGHTVHMCVALYGGVSVYSSKLLDGKVFIHMDSCLEPVIIFRRFLHNASNSSLPDPPVIGQPISPISS